MQLVTYSVKCMTGSDTLDGFRSKALSGGGRGGEAGFQEQRNSGQAELDRREDAYQKQ